MAVFQKGLIDLLNRTDSPSHKIMLFGVPYRSLRIIATDDSFKSFRVEQLVITNKDIADPRGSWNTLSTHGGQHPGAAWGIACKGLLDAQDLLAKKLKQRQVRVPA